MSNINTMANTSVRIHPKDNVIVALTDLKQGDVVVDNGQEIPIREFVPAKHKFVRETLEPGSEIIMYGVTVGTALYKIEKGGVISTRNVAHKAKGFGKQTRRQEWHAPDVARWRDRTFMGYHRSDGQVGTANYWVVIPMV